MSYFVYRTMTPPDLQADFNSPDWKPAETAQLRHFRPEGSNHHPDTRFKLLYDDLGLYGLFQVNDRFVRCRASHFQDMVCHDSCIEFFIQPSGGTGYLNFEFNASGVMLCQLIRDPCRPDGTFRDARPLSAGEVKDIRVFHSLPERVDDEIREPVTYRLGFFIPFSLFSATHHVPVPVPGSVWHGNFYKCADQTSHPHWSSFWPLNYLSFHTPNFFGPLHFLPTFFSR